MIILCENDSSRQNVERGTSLRELTDNKDYIAAYVDGKAVGMDYEIYRNSTVRFIELASVEGMRIYTRSMIFMLCRASKSIFGNESQVVVMHPMGSGYYLEIKDREVTSSEIEALEAEMQRLVAQDIEIKRMRVESAEALSVYRAQGNSDKAELLSTRGAYWVDLFDLDGLKSNAYGALVGSTSQLGIFKLLPFERGIALLLPSKESPNKVVPPRNYPKHFNVFMENEKWLDIMGTPSVGALNHKIREGKGRELVLLGEALQEKNFSDLADTIFHRYEKGLKTIFISGPSSSGKTTFAKRLSLQLEILGLTPHRISLDDYFVDREHTPRDEFGNFDFEALEAVDIKRFSQDMSDLYEGKEVELPRFDFIQGRGVNSGTKLQLGDRGIILIEGIHALNPVLSDHIEKDHRFMVYVSALTALSLDTMNVIHTSDNRLLRRMVRDNNFRGRSASTTLAGWASVRRGEERNIFPYQENADVMFNTALVFEFSILRHYAEPLLRTVPAGSEEYYEAQRLLKFLKYFDELPTTHLPRTSLMCEFLGGSSFSY